MSAKPKCRNCAGAVVHGNLYCSAGCGQQATADWKQAIASLMAAGFEAGHAPNIYCKDGVAVTLEEIEAHGLYQTLARHHQSAQRPRIAGNRTVPSAY